MELEIEDQWRLTSSHVQANTTVPEGFELNLKIEAVQIEVAKAGQLGNFLSGEPPKTERKTIKFTSVLTDKSMTFGEVKILF